MNNRERHGCAKRNTSIIVFRKYLIAILVIQLLPTNIRINALNTACGFQPSGVFLLPECRRVGRTSTTFLEMSGVSYGKRSSSKKYSVRDRTQGHVRSKRQERVGSLIRVELANILQRGQVKRTDPIEATLLQKINVVNADVSPDLAQARITVSILGKGAEANIQKRRAYSWLVSSQKMIRHALAQRLNYMKTVPMLTFALADVGAAVDVMALIDKVTKDKDFKRDLPDFNSIFQEDATTPSGVHFGLDFNERAADDDAWIDEEDDDEVDEYLE
jgi:ribosome-binding factor A